MLTGVFAQTNDLSMINSLEEYETFKKQQEITESLDTYYKHMDDVVWNNFQMQDVYLKEMGILMTLDNTIKNNTIQCIDFLKSTYKDKLRIERNFFSTDYSFENKYYKINLEVEEEEKDINERTRGKIELTFKPLYDIPLSQISNSFDENPKTGKLYYVDVEYCNNGFDLFLNGVPVASQTGRYNYLEERRIPLNPYITDGNLQQITVKVTPGRDEEGNRFKTIIKDSRFRAFLVEELPGSEEEINKTEFCTYYEYVTDTITEDGDTHYYSYPGTYQYGGESLPGSYRFTPEIHYAVSAWKNGRDLRQDKDLKPRIIALYQQLADALKMKDEQKFSDLLYQTYYETVASTYNMQEERTEVLWQKNWLPIIHHSYRYTIDEDFDLLFSEDGKLVYANPLEQKDMLRAIGKRRTEGFTFYICEDAATKQLKFIRK
jgi:hypothetical protein